MNTDQRLMELAINQARKAGPETWLNPRVGAVIVKDSHILATGHTHKYGGFHAERDAISKLSPEQLLNSTLYVTLEPCNHYGKQPPCSQLIIKSGIRRVVIAETDPHPLVTGKGIANLRAHGIDVQTGVLTDQARQLNPYYNFYFQHQRPWVTIKQAISLDGKVSAEPGQRTAITNQAVYDRVHRERADYQGIVIGSKTALVDNPRLLTTVETPFPPVRIILDRRGRLGRKPHLKLLTDGCAPTWIFTNNSALRKELQAAPAKVIVLKHCSIQAVISEVAKRGLQALYVEGGPTIQQAFLQAGTVDELITYVSPQFLGMAGVSGLQSPKQLTFAKPQIELLDDNVRIAERKQ